MAPDHPYRPEDDEDERAAIWGERSEGFLVRYVPYAVGLTVAMGILWWGAVPQFRAAGQTASAEVGVVAAAATPEASASVTASAVPSASPSPEASASPSVEPSPAETASTAAVAPATAVVTASSAGIVLTGNVASEEVRSQLVTAAKAAVGSTGTVQDQLTVSGAAEGATVTYTGSLSPEAAASLRAANTTLSGAGIEVKDELSVETVSSTDIAVADKVNEMLKADPVLFDTGSAQISASSKKVLNSMAKVLTDNPTVKVEIRGYTDNQGVPAKNLALSQQRATAVKRYLVAQGVAADRLSAKGFGEADPVASNATEQGRQLNRRITVQATG